MTTRVYITPHSTDPAAVEATKATLRSLPTWPLTNIEDNLDAGRIVGETANADFLRFACERQGYACKVETQQEIEQADEDARAQRREQIRRQLPVLDKATARALLNPIVPKPSPPSPAPPAEIGDYPTLRSLGFVVVRDKP